MGSKNLIIILQSWDPGLGDAFFIANWPPLLLFGAAEKRLGGFGDLSFILSLADLTDL